MMRKTNMASSHNAAFRNSPCHMIVLNPDVEKAVVAEMKAALPQRHHFIVGRVVRKTEPETRALTLTKQHPGSRRSVVSSEP